MRLLVENRFALLGLVMVALTTLFGIALVTTPSTAEDAVDQPEPLVTRVESALRVCPPSPDGDSTTEILAFTPTAEDGRADGNATVLENAPEGAELGTIDVAGEPWAQDIGDAERHSVIRARGGLAGGLEATQTTLGGAGAPVTASTCPSPGLSNWFLVPGGARLADLELYLANVDDTPSTVNVDIYAPEGPLYAPELRAISVDPHGEESIDLTELSEAVPAMAVHVRTNRGRIAPSLLATRSDSGTDWVPAATEPDTRHVIPGVPPGGGSRQLVVATHVDEPVDVSVRLFTTEGEAEHDQLERLEIPPAASATLSLEGPLNEHSGTVLVESDQPIVAGVAMSREDGDDTAYTAATPPLEAPLDARAVAVAPPEATARLLLGAPEENGTVSVTPVALDGEHAAAQEVVVEAGHTVVPEIEGAEDAHALIVDVAEGSGPIYAAQVISQGSGEERSSTVRPLPPAPVLVALPATSDTLSSVVP